MRDRDRIFLDTNILIYLANEDSPFHSATLIKFKEISLGHEMWISRQVLREYAVVMTREGLVEKPLSSEEVVMRKFGDVLHFITFQSNPQIPAHLSDLNETERGLKVFLCGCESYFYQ